MAVKELIAQSISKIIIASGDERGRGDVCHRGDIMPPKHVSPSIDRKAFSCPNCGVLADQYWFDVHATGRKDCEPPNVSTSEVLAQMLDSPDQLASPNMIALAQREATGEPFLDRLQKGVFHQHELRNIHVSRCRSCQKISIWRHDALLYPPLLHDVEPNADLPDDIRADFEEARAILELSPRGAAALLRVCVRKLCNYLGQPGENISDDITTLVKSGLDPKIQQALGIVRVVGSDAVHPGVMDPNDDRALAAKLFKLVNIIAHNQITEPKEIAELFGTPSGNGQAASPGMQAVTLSPSD